MKKSLQYCFTLFTLLLIATACTTDDDLANATVQVTAPGEFSDSFAERMKMVAIALGILRWKKLRT